MKRLTSREALESALVAKHLDSEVDVTITGCHGFCERGTLVHLAPEGILYTHVSPEDATEIVTRTVMKKRVIERLLYALPTKNPGERGERIARPEEIPFYQGQTRLVLGLNGRIDPTRIEEYLREGGYQALATALFELEPDAVIEEVIRSGLRGRGGGGFPTGQKWRVCRQSPGVEKHVICNADEGDPGAFMDRSLMEGNPHAVIEGMIIGAYAIGATAGHIFIRAEYPLALDRLRIALDQARAAGLLGEDILGSGFSFDIHIKEGAGAFVCGEETALIASIEGHRGLPRPRPPFPATRGLFGMPTTINNVETWGNIPLIIGRGADEFARLGTPSSRGTKIFSLVGKVNNTGLVEVPMGMPLRQLVEEIGGGVRGGKLKAVQTGGPSGGCIPARLLDLPIEYEELARAGSIMGSGGLVVMDESTCMVDLARYFLTFTQDESCGKCTPCRLGTRRMLSILERICAGKGRPGDIELLEQLGPAIKATSLCGLGQTAPNPVLTTLRYFREEYEEHVYKRHCRAAVCSGLVDAPCHHTCPAGVEAQRYVREIAQGKFENAYLVVRERMPFPSVCGTVCYHPCEARCRRGQLDDPVAVRALKGAAVRYGARAERRIKRRITPTGKKVAVVGSGPAGLTTAYYLALKGHGVTVFEELPVVGGMLRTGIPRYRLPERDLERDIEIVRKAGVKIRTRARVTSVHQLKRRGFDAVFLALGAHASWKLGVPGEDETGVLDCVGFLRRVSLGEPPKLGRRVAVVGGGNTAIDAARTALRLGAREVTILYRRSREEMPADRAEIEDALAEGVKLETLTIPKMVKKTPAHLTVTCLRMRLSETDETGRRRPVPVEGSEFERRFDAVLSAIGQFPAIPKEFGIEADPKSRLVSVHPESLATSVEGVFAGGDVVSGPASVIEAIAHGRRAAEAIDRHLGGDGDTSEILAPPEDVKSLPPLRPETGARRRIEVPVVAPLDVIRGFGAVELGFSREAAIEEASRCLRCDLEE